MNRIILAALLVAICAAPVNSREKHAEQRGITKSAEGQKSGADVPTLWPIYSLTWPAREEKKIEPDWRNPDCRYPHGHEEADLCEQRKMSESAADTVFWNKWQFALSAFGFAALLYTIFLTYRATSAAIESNKIARDSLESQTRAYISADRMRVRDFSKGNYAEFTYDIVNCGQTPAHDLEAMAFVIVCDDPQHAAARAPAGQNTIFSSKIVAGPHQPIHQSVKYPELLSHLHIDDIVTKKKTFLFCGIIRYRDIFGRRHWTIFRTYFGAEQFKTGDDSMAACRRHNIAN